MTIHASDCAMHDAPAFPAGPCTCGASDDTEPRDEALPPLAEDDKTELGFGAPVSDVERIRKANEYVTDLRKLRGARPRDLDH